MLRSTTIIVLFLSVRTIFAFGQAATIDYEQARFDKRLIAKRALGNITVDAVLDEPDWAEASLATNFTQSDPREGESATFETEVRMLYDDENLYFGFMVYDDDPDNLVINDLKRDFSPRSGDVVGVVLDTFHDQRNGYLFETSPAGAKFDGQFSNEGR